MFDEEGYGRHSVGWQWVIVGNNSTYMPMVENGNG